MRRKEKIVLRIFFSKYVTWFSFGSNIGIYLFKKIPKWTVNINKQIILHAILCKRLIPHLTLFQMKSPRQDLPGYSLR